MAHLNSEYFPQSTTLEPWEIQFLAQIFYTASRDPKNIKLGTKKYFFDQQNFERARPQIS
jgi:hypothetical protein